MPASGFQEVGRPLPSIKRNILYALIGNGTLNLCRMGVVILLAKYATAKVVAGFHFANVALSAPIILFFGLELRAAFVADARGEYSFGTYRALRRLGTGIAAAILLAGLLLIGAREPNPALIWMMAGVCAARVVLQIAEVDWGLYQRFERIDLLCWSNAVRGLLIFAPFAILVPLAHARGAAAGESVVFAAALAAALAALGSFAVWWFFDRRFVRRFIGVDHGWSWDGLKRLALNTLPLGLVTMILTLCEAVAPWVMTRVTGGLTPEIGYFGALRIITLGATFLIVQIGNAAANRLALRYQTDLTAFVRLAGKLGLTAAAIGAALLCVTWLFGEPFLRVLYTGDYSRYYPEFLILVAAQSVFLLGSIFGFITTHMRRFWIQVPLQLTILASTVIAALLLIPADPVSGAAWTIMVRSIVQTVLYSLCVLSGIRLQKEKLGRAKVPT